MSNENSQQSTYTLILTVRILDLISPFVVHKIQI